MTSGEFNNKLQQIAGAASVALYAELVIGVMVKGHDNRPPRVTAREKYELVRTLANECLAACEEEGSTVIPYQVRWLSGALATAIQGLERLDKDNISGKVTTLSPCDSLDEFLSLFGEVSLRHEVFHLREVAPDNLLHEEVHQRIRKVLEDRPEVLGAVCFENLTMDSSQIGARSALIFGPGCTYASIDEIKDGKLGSVPSDFKYPVRYWIKPARYVVKAG